MNKDGTFVQVIIPTITKDYIRMRDLVPQRLFRYLPVKELIFIGNDELCDMVVKDKSDKYSGLNVTCLNEDELIKKQPIVERITERVRSVDDELLLRLRPGWYYQQFLKMAFYNRSEEDYYASWDMDTVPLRKIDLFDEGGSPIFGMKSEYNPGYFKTIENLLSLKKNTEGSFISEHMMFSKACMGELIDYIEKSANESEDFAGRIIDCVDEDYITLGFSEFETYGTFVTDRHPDMYSYRKFDSFRRGSWFVNVKDVTGEDLEWFAADYDAVTFENAKPISDMVALFRNPKYRNNMPARKFYETILESGYFGNYSEGRLDTGDWFAPV